MIELSSSPVPLISPLILAGSSTGVGSDVASPLSSGVGSDVGSDVASPLSSGVGSDIASPIAIEGA